MRIKQEETERIGKKGKGKRRNGKKQKKGMKREERGRNRKTEE